MNHLFLLSKKQLKNEKNMQIKGKITKSAATFMHNKPNFVNSEIGVSSFQTSKYEILPAGSGEKTNPKQTQFKPNCRNGKINTNSVFTEDYEEKCGYGLRKTKPIQTQSKPIKADLKKNECKLLSCRVYESKPAFNTDKSSPGDTNSVDLVP